MLTVALGVGLGGCVLGASEPAPPAEIVVTELDGPFAPLGIQFTGLPAGELVTLTSTAELPAAWYSSEAEFRVGDDGTVDLAAVAPESGDWAGADSMAPFWSMHGTRTARWDIWDEAFDVELTVRDAAGEELAQTVVTRPGTAPGVAVSEVNEPGIEGVFALPSVEHADMAADTAGAAVAPRPGVLVFTGSDGGLDGAAATARWVAGLGYPALGISYFGGEGQPEALENVPVETFEAGLAWLRAQPEVDLDRVFTFGISRGGEMALWLATEHPDLVTGAIAPVGAGAVVCGYPQGIAWTRGGEALAGDCTMSVVGSPSTRLDVAAIDGPVVLACGTDDELWDSCAALDDIVDRRSATDATTLATRGEGAMHAVSWPPYLPLFFGASVTPQQIAATRAVQQDFWRDVVSVLAE